jgi:hypothetical protein
MKLLAGIFVASMPMRTLGNFEVWKTIAGTLRRESASTEARSAGRRVSRWPEIVSGYVVVLHE